MDYPDQCPEAPAIGRALVRWFRQNCRDLPWRRDRGDPYRVWVSEIMLQQTQVRTVEPYYERWMGRFPTVQALAATELDDVLRVWEGLGYYSRARRLHEAARIVVSRFDCRLPEDVHELRGLPGIGDYTAGAIAAIAFNRPAVALDANARRVVRRILAEDAGDADLRAMSRAMMPEDSAGDYAQALFELGARVCTARRAECELCPVVRWCGAHARGSPLQYGGSGQTDRTTRLIRAAAVVTFDDRVLVVRRGPEGLWSGLWEFPWRDVGDGEEAAACAVQAAWEVAGVHADVGEHIGSLRHAVTRYSIRLCAVRCVASAQHGHPRGCAEIAWLSWQDLERLPMPAPQRRLVRMATPLSRLPCSQTRCGP